MNITYLIPIALLTVAAVTIVGYQPESLVKTSGQREGQTPVLIPTQSNPSLPIAETQRETVITEEWRQQVEAFGFDPEEIVRQEALNNTRFEASEGSLQQLSTASYALVNQLQQREQAISKDELISINQKIDDQIQSIEQMRLSLNNDMGQVDQYKTQFEQYAQVQLQRLRYLQQTLSNSQKEH